jgi:hypothetical protein
LTFAIALWKDLFRSAAQLLAMVASEHPWYKHLAAVLTNVLKNHPYARRMYSVETTRKVNQYGDTLIVAKLREVPLFERPHELSHNKDLIIPVIVKMRIDETRTFVSKYNVIESYMGGLQLNGTRS